MSSHPQILDRLRSRTSPLSPPNGALLPDYDGFCIARIPDVIRRALGCSDQSTALGELLANPHSQRVVLVILDGFGYHKFHSLQRTGHIETLGELADRGAVVPLTSVFPSTTVAALATYTTGQTPQEHGLIGYRLYLRETGTITNMIHLTALGQQNEGAIRTLGLDLDTFLGGATVFDQLAAAGIATYTLLPQHITGSGLSSLLYRGCSAIHGCITWTDMLTKARSILSNESGPALVTLYWPSLDSVAHVRGPDTASYAAEASAIDQALRRELIDQVHGALLLVSSDHGFVSMAPTDYVPLDSLPPLAESCLIPPLGEPRTSYLYTRQDADMAAAAKLDHSTLWCVPSQHAMKHGLFGIGEPHPEAQYRIGDLVVTSTGTAGIAHPYGTAPKLLGMHGGLTEEEMLVPLIVSSL